MLCSFLCCPHRQKEQERWRRVHHHPESPREATHIHKPLAALQTWTTKRKIRRLPSASWAIVRIHGKLRRLNQRATLQLRARRNHNRTSSASTAINPTTVPRAMDQAKVRQLHQNAPNHPSDTTPPSPSPSPSPRAITPSPTHPSP